MRKIIMSLLLVVFVKSTGMAQIKIDTIVSQPDLDTIWFKDKSQIKIKDSTVHYRITNLRQKKFKDFYLFQDFDSLGVKLRQGSTLKKDEDAFMGEVIIYDREEGYIKQKVRYKDGARFGPHKTFYKSGKLKSTGSYLFDVLNGASKNYSENGRLHEIGAYKNGKREGTWKVFYPNGKLKEQGMYKNNVRIGVWKVFYYNGQFQ